MFKHFWTGTARKEENFCGNAAVAVFSGRPLTSGEEFINVYVYTYTSNRSRLDGGRSDIRCVRVETRGREKGRPCARTANIRVGYIRREDRAQPFGPFLSLSLSLFGWGGSGRRDAEPGHAPSGGPSVRRAQRRNTSEYSN